MSKFHCWFQVCCGGGARSLHWSAQRRDNAKSTSWSQVRWISFLPVNSLHERRQSDASSWSLLPGCRLSFLLSQSCQKIVSKLSSCQSYVSSWSLLSAGFPSCCHKVVTKLFQSCPLSIFLISPPMLQALFLVWPLLVLVLLRDLLGRLLAGPCLCVYLSACVFFSPSICLLV